MSGFVMALSTLDKLIAGEGRRLNSVTLNDTRNLCSYVVSMIID